RSRRRGAGHVLADRLPRQELRATRHPRPRDRSSSGTPGDVLRELHPGRVPVTDRGSGPARPGPPRSGSVGSRVRAPPARHRQPRRPDRGVRVRRERRAAPPRGTELMASLTVIWWRDIPAQVLAREGRRASKVQLHPRFQVAIDKAASRAGKRAYSEYIEEWRKVARECGEDLGAEVNAD